MCRSPSDQGTGHLDRTRLAASTLEATDQELHAPNAEGHAEHDNDDGIELGNHGGSIGEDTAQSDSTRQHIACTPLRESELHDKPRERVKPPNPWPP